MIDLCHEIFAALAGPMKEAFPGLVIRQEYLRSPSKFPCMTAEEISNLPVGLDSGEDEPRNRITYRIQVFTLQEKGGREEARAILSRVSALLYALNFTRKSLTPQNEQYRSQFYALTAAFEAEADREGRLYRT